jgi:hypothetical protein
VEVPRRQSALVVKAELPFELPFAAFAYADERVIFNQHHCFAPDFQAISCAAFSRVK